MIRPVELPVDLHLELPVLVLLLLLFGLGMYALSYRVTGLARWCSVFLLFSAATVVQTWPLALHATEGIMDWPFFPVDSIQFLWGSWWLKHALLELHTSPFHTDLLLRPQGAELGPQVLVSGILSIPLQVATGNLFLSSNVLALLSFVLSGVGMYALVYRITANHAAAVLSGYVFAFSPYILMHAPGHWAFSATWPLPLFVLFLVRFQDTGRLRDAVGAAVFWAVLTNNVVELSVDAGMFLGLFLAYWSFVYIFKKDWLRLSSHWLGAVVIVAVWLALSLPSLIPAWKLQSGELYAPPGGESYSADLLAFVTPSPLWGPGTLNVEGGQVPPYNHFPVGSIENTAYLGGVPLLLGALALLAIRRTPHRVLFWAAAFLFFAILALGPYLYIDGTKSLSLLGNSFTVPLPYLYYDDVPVVGHILAVKRVPARAIMFGILAFSVLVGVGLDLLASWLKPRYTKIIPLVAVLALSVVVLEYWNAPVPVTRYSSPPDIYDQIGDEPGDFTLLDAPLGRRSGFDNHGHATVGPMTNYYQMFHRKATIGGLVARVNRSEFAWILDQPGLHYLACHYECPNPNPSAADLDPVGVRQLLRRLQVKYVLLHRQDLTGTGLAYVGERELRRLDAYLRIVLRLTPVYEDSNVTVYRNPDIPDAKVESRSGGGS